MLTWQTSVRNWYTKVHENAIVFIVTGTRSKIHGLTDGRTDGRMEVVSAHNILFLHRKKYHKVRRYDTRSFRYPLDMYLKEQCDVGRTGFWCACQWVFIQMMRWAARWSTYGRAKVWTRTGSQHQPELCEYTQKYKKLFRPQSSVNCAPYPFAGNWK